MSGNCCSKNKDENANTEIRVDKTTTIGQENKT
jgi:hypothetical protein